MTEKQLKQLIGDAVESRIRTVVREELREVKQLMLEIQSSRQTMLRETPQQPAQYAPAQAPQPQQQTESPEAAAARNQLRASYLANLEQKMGIPAYSTPAAYNENQSFDDDNYQLPLQGAIPLQGGKLPGIPDSLQAVMQQTRNRPLFPQNG